MAVDLKSVKIGEILLTAGDRRTPGRVVEVLPPHPMWPDSTGYIRLSCLNGAIHIGGPPADFIRPAPGAIPDP